MSAARHTIEELLDESHPFVGREKELQIFSDLLSSPKDSSAHICVLQLYGVGGIGKTSILSEYKEICNRKNYPIGHVNIRVQRGSILDLLDTFRKGLGLTFADASNYFSDYDDQAKQRQKIEDKLITTIASRGDVVQKSTSEGIVGTATGFGGIALGSLLGPLGAVVGGGFGSATGKAVMESFGEKLVANLVKKGLKLYEARLLVDADKVLTKAFVKGVNAIAEQAEIAILMVDTYEEVAPIIDEWFRDNVISKLQTNVLVVIAGRDKLTEQNDNWFHFSKILRMVEIHCFDEADAYAYLAQSGVVNKDLASKFLTFTEGLPWALALLMDIRSDGGVNLFEDNDRQGKIKYIVGHRVVKRFLQQIAGTDLSDMIDVCTVARRFNNGLLQKILNNSEQVTNEQIENLRRYSFVRVLNDGSLALHDIVREFMMEELKARNFERYKKNSKLLRKYYQECLQAEPTIGVRKRYMTELLYHYLHEDENAGIKFFIQTISELDMYTQFDLRDALLNEISLFKFEKSANKFWQDYCQAYRAVNQGRWNVAEKHLKTVINAPDIPELLLCLAYDTLGDLFIGQGRYRAAIGLFEKSLVLKQKLQPSKGVSGTGQTLSKLTECNAIVGKYRKAEQYANKILSVVNGEDKRSSVKAWALKSLGDTYRLWGKTKLSIANFENALSIFEHLSDDYAIAHVHTQLGRVYLHDGQWFRAIKSLETASKTFEDIWVEYGRANTLLFLGNVYRFKKQWSTAEDFYLKALKAHEAMDAKREIGPLLGSLGVVYQNLGQYEKAFEFLQKSLKMKTEQEYLRGISVTQIYIGNFFLGQNKPEIALEHFEIARQMADKSQSNYHKCESRYYLAETCRMLKRYDNTRKFYSQAINIASKYRYYHLQSQLFALLGKINFLEGLDVQGSKSFKNALKSSILYNCYWLCYVAEDIIQFTKKNLFSQSDRVLSGLVAFWATDKLDKMERENVATEGLTSEYIPFTSLINSSLKA